MKGATRAAVRREAPLASLVVALWIVSTVTIGWAVGVDGWKESAAGNDTATKLGYGLAEAFVVALLGLSVATVATVIVAVAADARDRRRAAVEFDRQREGR
jgi:hypothetical protein